MIVIGVDVHKQSLTAVAVDEARPDARERTCRSTAQELLAWAAALGEERLWALEDCRQLTRELERALLGAGEQLVRVPPKLTAPQRRAGRMRGKSDAIDALAVARAALREPRLDRPRPGERALRELKLLVDHREDLVDERRRSQQRLRWHLHELDPALVGARWARSTGTVWLDRVGSLARPPRADGAGADRPRTRRPLPHRSRARSSSSTTNSNSGRADRAGAARAARLRRHHRREAARRDRPDRPLPTPTPSSPATAGVAPLEASSGKHQRHRLDRGGNRQLNCALYRIAITQAPHPPARTRLPRTQTSRRQEPPRSDPLPQTTPRPHRLQHPQKRAPP